MIELHVGHRVINAADGGRITDGTLNSVLHRQSYAMDATNSYLANLDSSPPSRRRSGNVILGGDEHFYISADEVFCYRKQVQMITGPRWQR
jgi:hypothetical protein